MILQHFTILTITAIKLPMVYLKKNNDIGIYPFYTNGRELFNFFIPAEFADIKVLEIKFKEIK